MKDEHIIELLDAAPLSALGEAQLSRIHEHVERCSGCRQAYRAARISTSLLRQRATVVAEPSPFFETRIRAALRERAARPEPFSLNRMWRSAGALVYSMAALVLILTALTVSRPASRQPSGSLEGSRGLATDVRVELADWAVFDADQPAGGEMSYGQVLTEIYYPEGEREKTDGARQ